MRDTDVRVVDAAVTFRWVELDHPLTISGRDISGFTVAEVGVEVESRRGRRGRGRGSTVLSVPWAWPGADGDPGDRDATLRALTERLAVASTEHRLGDPIELWLDLEGDLGEVPRLAGLLALGAVDSAVHDAWAHAAARPAMSMYDAECLGVDLGAIASDLSGRYPGDYLTGDTHDLPVQHVVGVDDPLTPAECADGRRSLQTWLALEGTRHLKVKVAGQDPSDDARRVADVFEVAQRRHHLGGRVLIAVDPNEGYRDVGELDQFLDSLARLSPRAAGALHYLEQPVPRDADPAPELMRGLSERVPVLLDEGFTDVADLVHLAERGWSGVVVKASKGQSPAMLAYGVMKARGLWVTVQDLTTVDLAYVHSARLVSGLDLTSRHLEYNSRQYVPGGNVRVAGRYPALATVRDGQVRYPLSDSSGLYQLADPV
ncbi:enolase C-terminal domain-like protein [Phytoactinopolyspora limicola]|uniref:enolase C-terminal domain-like protein n=1 Tax=Phytoactinopolyspora limicola TaxID=2715536 RepID=UPI00140BECB8|nr:enolase C-terminal domain-like protein [Phytoactinopolyspora limicola]